MDAVNNDNNIQFPNNKCEKEISRYKCSDDRKCNNYWPVCHFHALPEWLQHNEFLINGHRPPLPSFRECFYSIFRLHTETLNIWTHLIGCVIFFFLMIRFYLYTPEFFTAMDKLALGMFLLGATFCFALSFAYHTFSCHSPIVLNIFSKLDYCGIAFLILASFVPWLYYGFYCDYLPKIFYCLLSITFCLLTVTISLWDHFNRHGYHSLRATIFSSFGLSGIFPTIHKAISLHISEFFLWNTFMNLISTAGLYALGALVYALRVPERFFPGKCDYWFHSHQLFHVFVIAAAITHYQNMFDLAYFRISAESYCNTLESFSGSPDFIHFEENLI